LSLAAQASRTPAEIEALGLWDAIAWSHSMAEQQRQTFEFHAAIAGIKLT
jgi:hypothetical protein